MRSSIFTFLLLFGLGNNRVQAQINRSSHKIVHSLSKSEAERLVLSEWKIMSADLASSLSVEWKNKALSYNGYTLQLKSKVSGARPLDGYSLYISMHGGGNQLSSFNDQQWENQIKLYTPVEGVYVAPRATTDTWNLWHQSHIDTLFDKLIQSAVIFEGVNPNKVYLMGYSAGGDGVYQLAPRMADRWAAAAMMAGHPNEAKPYGLRNIGFSIDMGGLDSAYNRNKIARNWERMLDSLQVLDPEGYVHRVVIHEAKAHWMGREDSVAVPWMARFIRNPLPERVVWLQDDVIHASFYWLAVDAKKAKAGEEVIAAYNKRANSITVLKNEAAVLHIRVNDKMLNLDKPVEISYLGNRIFYGLIIRKADIIRQTLKERKDPDLVFCGEITIVNGKIVK